MSLEKILKKIESSEYSINRKGASKTTMLFVKTVLNGIVKYKKGTFVLSQACIANLLKIDPKSERTTVGGLHFRDVVDVLVATGILKVLREGGKSISQEPVFYKRLPTLFKVKDKDLLDILKKVSGQEYLSTQCKEYQKNWDSCYNYGTLTVAGLDTIAARNFGREKIEQVRDMKIINPKMVKEILKKMTQDVVGVELFDTVQETGHHKSRTGGAHIEKRFRVKWKGKSYGGYVVYDTKGTKQEARKVAEFLNKKNHISSMNGDYDA